MTAIGAPPGSRPGARAATLAAFRVVMSSLLVLHGGAGLVGALSGTAGPAWPWLGASVVAVAAGVLVLLGLRTRTAALVAAASMAYSHLAVSFPADVPVPDGAELTPVFGWTFLLLALFGPGALALDPVLRRRGRP
ncbi:hypothetical protein [Saccharothrix syringae]|uniref:DoxX family membrane protein n=1 Tax=Saccharothrix syringae TaxID=103733 RepID=A0A5Q0H5H1_SACSY|nr:hypothetical protein [Saccharothrix syringae]QFZ21184.1 hypothetical protein EKG83_30760 [Saccharothrix syringae]